MKKEQAYKTLKFSRGAILRMNKTDARNFTVASKIYSDIAYGYYDFRNLSSTLPLKSKTPDEHIDSYKFLNSILGLSSALFESLKFFVTVEELTAFLIEKKINLKNDDDYPFKFVRNMLGSHYSSDKTFLELFNEIFKQYYVLEGKNLKFYLSTDSHESAFPGTTNINWTIMYIVDCDNEWKGKYQKNKSEYIRLKLKEVMADNHKLFIKWLDEYIEKIFEVKKIAEACCQKILGDVYNKNK